MSKVGTLVDCTDAEAVECLNDFIESIQTEKLINIIQENIQRIVKKNKLRRESI